MSILPNMITEMISRIGMKIKSMNLKNRKATNNIYEIIPPCGLPLFIARKLCNNEKLNSK